VRARLLLEDKQTLCYIADATGFGFGDKYNLNWKRGTQIRRKLSNENWKRYGKMRYRVEQLFGSIKQKIGSSEDVNFSGS
jgi:hypothetical protein